MQLFSLWWLAAYANQVIASVFYIAAAFGHTDVSLQTTYVYLQRLLLALSLVGLMQYLLYLQTGRDYAAPLGVFYALYLATQIYSFSVRSPVAVELRMADRRRVRRAGPARVGACGRRHRGPAGRRRARDAPRVPPHGSPTRRFRIAMLGVGFVVWRTLAVIAGQPSMYGAGWLQALNRLVGVGVAVGILLAYEPMAWMRRRYRLEPFSARG